MSESTGWYWDLRRQIAVPADERGPSDHVMGPYPTKHAAENWKQTVADRNDAWDADDDEWESRGTAEDR